MTGDDGLLTPSGTTVLILAAIVTLPHVKDKETVCVGLPVLALPRPHWPSVRFAASVAQYLTRS